MNNFEILALQSHVLRPWRWGLCTWNRFVLWDKFVPSNVRVPVLN